MLDSSSNENKFLSEENSQCLNFIPWYLKNENRFQLFFFITRSIASEFNKYNSGLGTYMIIIIATSCNNMLSER